MRKRQATAGSDKQLWSRKILKLYWVMFAIALSAQLYFMLTDRNPIDYFQAQFLPSIVLWTAGLAVLEAFVRILRRGVDYVMIVGMAYFCFILLLVHYSEPILVMTLFFPLLVSMFYLRRHLVLLAYLLALIDYVSMFVIHGGAKPYLDLKQIIIVACSLIFGAYLILVFMRHSADLARDLRTTTESKQELMIQNILMDKLAKTDALTGLYNHITFHEYLDDLIEQSEWSGLPLQLALLDIDDFKRINDTYGHRAGDMVLQRLAQTIREMVGDHDFAARYGGEEFAVIFTEKGLDEAVLILENIRKHISTIRHAELTDQSATVSIGVSEYRRGDGKEKLFTGADEALYEAKRSGKNKLVVKERVQEPMLF